MFQVYTQFLSKFYYKVSWRFYFPFYTLLTNKNNAFNHRHNLNEKVYIFFQTVKTNQENLEELEVCVTTEYLHASFEWMNSECMSYSEFGRSKHSKKQNYEFENK